MQKSNKIKQKTNASQSYSRQETQTTKINYFSNELFQSVTNIIVKLNRGRRQNIWKEKDSTLCSTLRKTTL